MLYEVRTYTLSVGDIAEFERGVDRERRIDKHARYMAATTHASVLISTAELRC